MDLELLATFLAVARSGGLRRAAPGLHRTQPALSARLRQLERQLECPLFERVGRRLVLTPAGRLVADEAPALLAGYDALLQKVRELGAVERATLRLATIDAASIYVLPEIYRDFRAAHPQVQLVVQVVDSRRVLAAVQSLEADVGVLVLPASHPDVEATAVYEERLVVVAGPGHPLADGRSPVGLADVAAHPLVLYGRGSTTRSLLDAVFERRRLVPEVAMETASPEAMKRLAEVGVGLTIVPEALARDEVAAGRLVRIEVSDAVFTRRLGTAVRRARVLAGTAERFLELLHRRYPPLDATARKQRGVRRSRRTPRWTSPDVSQ